MPVAAVEQEIREAVDRFYEALNSVLGRNDSGPMLESLSRDPNVSAMHPDGGRVVGWDEVRGVMEMWARNVAGGHVTPGDQRVHTVTDDVALVTGWERGGGRIGGEPVTVDNRVTLVFRREGGAWKVIHHHVDMSPAVRDAVQRVKA